jgi:hypothetical protein
MSNIINIAHRQKNNMLKLKCVHGCSHAQYMRILYECIGSVCIVYINALSSIPLLLHFSISKDALHACGISMRALVMCKQCDASISLLHTLQNLKYQSQRNFVMTGIFEPQ